MTQQNHSSPSRYVINGVKIQKFVHLHVEQGLQITKNYNEDRAQLSITAASSQEHEKPEKLQKPIGMVTIPKTVMVSKHRTFICVLLQTVALAIRTIWYPASHTTLHLAQQACSWSGTCGAA